MMIDKTEKRSINLILLLFSIICFLQLSGLKGTANYITAGLLIIIGLLSLCSSGWRIHNETGLVVLFIVFYVMTSILQIDIKYCVTYSINYFIILSPAMMLPVFERMIDKAGGISEKDIVRRLLIIWFAMVIISVVFYIQNPSAARILAANGDAYAGTLIGGYPLSYGSGLLCVAFFGSYMHCKNNKKKKLMLLAGCIMLLVLVYLTESTLTTFATAVGLLVAFVTNTKAKEKKKVAYYMFLLGVIVMAALFVYSQIESNITSIIAWLNTKSDVLIYRRIREIFNSVFLDVKSRHYSERTGLVSESLKLFAKSPLIGHGYKYGNVFSAGKAYGIGNHSEFFDCLAKYGIIGSMPLFLLYYKSMRQIAKQNLGVLASFVMMISFNPFITFASSLVVFIIIPLLYREEYRNIQGELTE